MGPRERGERAIVIPVAFDTETFPIKPARQAPRVVCVQIGIGADRQVYLRSEGLAVLRGLLESPDVLLVGHSIGYDALSSIATDPSLLGPWLAAYEADRVVCTEIREKLARIAEGSIDRYQSNGLLACLERYKIAHDLTEADKSGGDEGLRVRYCDLDGVDPALWSPDARRYALGDLACVDVYRAQAERFPAAWFSDQYRRARGDFMLRLTSAWGMMVDPRAVARFAALVEEEHRLVRSILETGDETSIARFAEEHEVDRLDAVPVQGGIVRRDGSKNTKIAKARMVSVCSARGLPVPTTDKGRELGMVEGAGDFVSLDADSCAASGDLQLRAYARYTSIGTLRGRADRLALAARLGVPVQPRFDPLKKTGRTSCSKGEAKPGTALRAVGDQTQNLNREAGLRECYVARPGYLILSSDWKAAELHTLSQTCADWGLDSALARVLREKDAHVWFAAVSNGWTYEWTIEALRGDHGPEAKKRAKAARQGAKACNFGFPGGLGIAKFRAWAAKTYGVIWSESEAQRRKAQWMDAFPEMWSYFRIITRIVDSGEPLEHPGSKRFRGDLSFTAAANSPFQGRCADMLIDAIWRLGARSLRGTLGGARLWNEAHDEILLEVPEPRAHEIALDVVQVMEAVGAEWCPIAPVKAEPALQRHWRKAAEPAHDSAGRLIAYEDRDLREDEIVGVRAALESGEDALRVSWRFGIEEDRVNAIGKRG